MSASIEIEKPLVSVVIPYYNGERFIEEAVGSVIRQSYRNWELLLVDDGSQEKPEKILAKYGYDKRFRYIRHEYNKGIAATRNTGMRAAKGEYIAFLDQDDIWLNDKLKKQIKVFMLATDNPGMVCTGMYFVDSRGVIFSRFNGYDDKNQNKMIKDMFFSSKNSGSIMMIKKQCVNETGFFDENFYAYDDFDYWMRTAKKFKIKYLNLPFVKKRFHESNTSLDNLSVFPDTLKAYYNACQIHPFLNKYKNKKIAHTYCKYGFVILSDNHMKLGRKYLLKAIQYSCFCWPAFIIYIFSFWGKSGVDFLIRIQKVKRFLFRFFSYI
jgi:glycosyltransferase involved in cell wall biosynthesis